MTGVIILLAGKGERMNLGYNKILYEINNVPIYKMTLEAFKDFDEIIVVKNESDNLDLPSNVKVAIGGKTRGESVYNGLKLVESDNVLIHDGARCFVSQEIIKNCLEALKENVLIGVGVKVKDTIKIYENGKLKTLKRDSLISMQTPQGGKTDILKKAYEIEKQNGFCSTDDLEVVEKHLNISPYIVLGDYNNIKITTREDLKWE